MGLQYPRRELPKRISRLSELASNLWWSWHEIARQVFRSLDYSLWRTSGHNPVRLLSQISEDRLESVARDLAFLELYDSVMLMFDADMSKEATTCDGLQLDKIDRPVAYFSAEYAVHNSLPIYAGGLGVLAGDICKESADMGLPLVAIGFMYPQGYFRQRISSEGDQQEEYVQLNFSEAPISPCAWPEGCGPFVPIQLGDREINVQVWQARVGRVNLYLLDTNVDLNAPEDRELSSRLYTADQEERIRQLLVLGIGGVRALRSLRIDPVVWHANEDHTAFMMLERLREELAEGLSLEEAIKNIRTCTIFTTHTPIPSGQHLFPNQLMDRYARNFWTALGIERETFLSLGYYAGLDRSLFSLSAFALRLAGQSNAVSKLHAQITKTMWRPLWPDQEVPISYVTNGAHLPTWQAPEIEELCQKYLGAEMRRKQTDEQFWQCVVNIPNEEFWRVRQQLKNRLIQAIRDKAQEHWAEGTVTSQQVIAMGALLDPYALTIVFARRFTDYKRPHLILSDVERIKKLVTNSLEPVQIVFSGKSHPADYQSKQLLKHVYRLALNPSFLGRLVFVEDYDMHLARDMVRGADVWLNNPRRLQEACGTSGMKASMNGVINLSVRDGWWAEAYNGKNGWAIGDLLGAGESQEDKKDAESLYNLLEKEIVPLYYDRDLRGVPQGWVQIAKDAIKSISPTFNACRMMKEYTQRMYIPAASMGRSS